MSPHEPFGRIAGIPLQAHLAELRSRCEAIARLQGSAAYFHEELGIFLSYAEEKRFFVEIAPAELDSPPDEEGNEHQVWHLPSAKCFLKATWPDFLRSLLPSICGSKGLQEHSSIPSPSFVPCQPVLANRFGHGTEQAAFLLTPP